LPKPRRRERTSSRSQRIRISSAISFGSHERR